jgi:hypothetical protein
MSRIEDLGLPKHSGRVKHTPYLKALTRVKRSKRKEKKRNTPL